MNRPLALALGGGGARGQAVAHWRPESLLLRQMWSDEKLESKGYAAPAMESH